MKPFVLRVIGIAFVMMSLGIGVPAKAQEAAPVKDNPAAVAAASQDDATEDAAIPKVLGKAEPDLQEPAVGNAIDPADGESSTDKPLSLGGMIVSGGSLNILFFGVLGLFSLWAATVVLERLVNLRQENVVPRVFVTQVESLPKTPAAGLAALRAAVQSKPSPATRILQAAVIRAGRPMMEVEKAMEDAMAREMLTMRGKYRPLNVVGNISPLVGLLGTVVGMIMAFQISSQAGLGKAEQLAEGIYLALMTTAAGLSLAIPCLLFASWFQARGERYMGLLYDALTPALPAFAQWENRSGDVAQWGDLRGPSNPLADSTGPGSTIPAVTGERQESSKDIEGRPLTARERFLREGGLL